VTSQEIRDSVWQHGPEESASAVEVVRAFHQHASDAVQRMGRPWQDRRQQHAPQIKEVDRLRQTSPLRPGTRLMRSGGDTAAFAPPGWWNDPKDSKATVLACAQGGADKMPVAFVELAKAIARTEANGLRHKGTDARRSLLYVAHGTKSETVTVPVVERLPEESDAFSWSHPFGPEIDTPATYTSASDDRRAVNPRQGNSAPSAAPERPCEEPWLPLRRLVSLRRRMRALFGERAWRQWLTRGPLGIGPSASGRKPTCCPRPRRGRRNYPRHGRARNGWPVRIRNAMMRSSSCSFLLTNALPPRPS
jgi:hypothetical protein